VPRRPALPREVWVLCAVAFSVALGFGIVAPALPLLATSFDVGNTAASAVISGFALMRFVSALGGGRLVDAVGERKVLGIGIGVVALSSAAAGASQEYWQLLLLRGIGGVGSAMFSISAFSLLLRSVETERRARASSVFNGGFLLGGVLGPLLGGLVTAGSFRAPFFVYAGTLVVAGTIGLLFLPRHLVVEDLDAAAPQARTTMTTALRFPAYRSALVTAMAQNGAAFGLRSALLPLFVVATSAEGGLGLDPRWTGIGIFVSAGTQAALLPLTGRYADRRGRKPLVLAGLLLLGVALLSLSAASATPSYLAAMAVFGASSAMLSVAPAAMVGDVVAGRGGTAFAAYSMAGDLGTISMPLIAGAISDAYGFDTAYLVAAALLVLPLAVAADAPETLTREVVERERGGLREDAAAELA
jgi:MFS transporter, DHA1 family, multidrug resistance protein